MITIIISTDRVKIRGHASYAPRGQDIVCAGITALTQTLIESIETLTSSKILYEISPGRVDIKFENPNEVAQLLVGSFFVGTKMIADEFPDNVRVAGSNGLGSQLRENGLGQKVSAMAWDESNEPGQKGKENV